MEYHVFQNSKDYYLYITDIKQLFLIPADEYNIFKTNIDSKAMESLLVKYKQVSNEEDFYELTNPKNYRYGLFLCVANTCNLRCSYCFAHQGDYGKSKGLMDIDTAKKSIDFYMEQVPENCDAYIIFFGGEPMLSYDIIEKVCSYVKATYSRKKFKFHIVTNGTLFKKNVIDFFKENDFGVAVSIDGGKSIQDTQRPMASGKSSYDAIKSNLSYLLENIPNVHARGTYTDFNYSLVTLYKDLLNLGFKEVNIPPDILNPISNVNFDKVLKQLDYLYLFVLEYSIDHEDFPFGLFIEHIRRLFIPKINSSFGCGIGESTFSVDIHGDVYPCHRFSSIEESKIGNVFHTVRVVKESEYSNKCKSCWNRYTCSHGCKYNDIMLSENTVEKNQYWCMYSQKMTELSLALCANLNENTIAKILCVGEESYKTL
ncbi:MAG: radical SAM protein [Firmicutes bacterium]|nr:radical SAM protein [Bacillota bacterium]